ncbi:DUF6479 family protein [Streptacidiphilus cavernicola]|uniref:DUF6479 family protein n=1 Tax=Streptacidiphilus cavernicola TaxID=3342716 RepID=A0ABV6VQI4_9ACTN
MNISMPSSTVLAAPSSGSSWIIAVVAGVIVVAALIGAFAWGARRREREPAPLPADGGPAQAPSTTDPQAVADRDRPDADSWATPPGTPGQSPRGQ